MRLAATGRCSAAALAALTVAALAGCGGSSTSTQSGVPTGVWVSRVCGSLQSWLGTVTKAPASLESPAPTAGLADIKSALAGYLRDVATASNTMLDNVKTAGHPAIDKGRLLENDFVNLLQPVVSAFSDAERRAEALPVNDGNAFKDQAEQIGNALNTAGDQAKTSFEKLKSKYPNQQLDSAFRNDPKCKSLNNASPSP
ncbi:MAG TPA: hypothetical protein VE219_06350 [Candidatus Sulfotelmatobacter sp.]|nr:hypothetical protein [Candidatus Sulfotelmatobacter sp.]